MKIYYLIPDIDRKKLKVLNLIKSIVKFRCIDYLKKTIFRKPKPCGGVKVILQHCELLKEMGFDANAVSLADFEDLFFGYKYNIDRLSDIRKSLNPNDVIVIPEIIQNHAKFFPNQKKVLFAQTWSVLYDNCAHVDQIIYGSYKEAGYDYVMTCSDFISKSLVKCDNDITVQINNFIDHSIFFENPSVRVRNRVLFLPRKNKSDVEYIAKGISHLPVEIVYADGLTQEQLVLEYQKSDFFIPTGYPEGFGLPPLEAMSCGCIVIGFTGKGADEYMIHKETALVSKDGDVADVVQNIVEVFNQEDVKNTLRKNGLKISKKYNVEQTKHQLNDFYMRF